MANVVRDASGGSPEQGAVCLSSMAASDDHRESPAAGRAVDPGGVRGKIAVLCAQERLRTILRLSLQADDHDVVEWNHRSAPDDPSVAAIIIDLDSLGHDVLGTLDLLGSWGIDESISLLFISVYPLDLRIGAAGRLVRRVAAAVLARCAHRTRA